MAAGAGSIPLRPLGRTTLELTVLGFGGGPIGWLDGPDTDARAAGALAAAWDAGIRYFDTAPLYGFGHSERRLGAFLRGQERGSFRLSTKVGRLLEAGAGEAGVVFDYSADGALRSVERSLDRLGLDRLDIVLIHDIDRWTHGDAQPQRFREALNGAWPALAELRAAGVIDAVGLGVNEFQVCEAFLREADVDCFLLAGRHTLLERCAEATFLPMCAERGIGVIVGGPFNSGILASGAVGGARYNYASAPQAVVGRVRRMEEICRSGSVPLGAAAVQFPLRSAAVTAVIPGMQSADEVLEVTSWAAAPVSDAVWRQLEALRCSAGSAQAG